MSQVLTVLDMVAADALAVAHEKATFIGTTDKQFDASYNAAHNNSKNGQTLRIREPNRFTRRQGSRVMVVQDQQESTQTVTVGTQDGVDIRFNSAELAQTVGDYKSSGFKTRYIEPAVSQLVSGIDSDMIVQFTKDIYNVVGTSGTVVGSSSGDLSAIHAARARLNQGLAPKDDRAVQIDSVTMAAIANGNRGLFTPNQSIDKAFLDGYYGKIAGADFYENERTWSVTFGSDVTANTDAASLVTDGGIIVDFHTDKTVAASIVGETFTIAGVYACHAETKASLGYLQPFTIISLNAASVNVSPTIYLGLSTSTAAKQNVCKSTGAQLALTDFDAKACVFFGTANQVLRQNIMYHKNAFAFVTAELPLIRGEECSRMTKDGLSLRVWQGADIVNDEVLMRVDILYGGKTLRPEWATRITN